MRRRGPIRVLTRNEVAAFAGGLAGVIGVCVTVSPMALVLAPVLLPGIALIAWISGPLPITRLTAKDSRLRRLPWSVVLGAGLGVAWGTLLLSEFRDLVVVRFGGPGGFAGAIAGAVFGSRSELYHSEQPEPPDGGTI